MTDGIEAKIQRLQDVEDIKTLRYKYAYGANIVDGQAGDLKAFGELFAEDGTWDVGLGVATGPAEVEAMMRALTVQWQAAMHYMLNPVVEVTGDRATGTFTGLFAFTTRTQLSPIWLSIIYTDTYVRTGAGWRFQSVIGKNVIADPNYMKIYADFVSFAL
jgi:hypothetical protein